jgi:hypothetical protein
LTEGVDWVRDKDGHIHHPLTKRAFESGVAMWHFCDDRGLLEDNGDSDLFEMVFHFRRQAQKSRALSIASLMTRMILATAGSLSRP